MFSLKSMTKLEALTVHRLNVELNLHSLFRLTDKKENQIFLIFKEIQGNLGQLQSHI
jgi:hypothetical protein